MATITYYFNSKSSDWANNPENMIDGNIDTDASSDVNEQIELLDGNEGAGADLGTVTKVEIRSHGWLSGGAAQFDITPVFGGVDDGDRHDSGVGFVEGWAGYVDITSDTNNPGTWDWSDVQNLECKAINVENGGGPQISKVEIRVTYTPSFTSKATGNWDAESESTWNEPGHPEAGSVVTIQNGHTVTLDSATACTTLTIDSGGVLTDATNNVGLTVTGLTIVAGTLTCGTAAMGFTVGLEIQTLGTFVGGSGAHNMGYLRHHNAVLTSTLTSGTTTITGHLTNYCMYVYDANTFSASTGTVVLTHNGALNYYCNNQSLYNLTLNNAALVVTLIGPLNVDNDFIVTAGELTDSGNLGISVTGSTDITDTLTCGTAAVDLDGDVTINGAGELVATTGITTFSGTTWTNSGTFTHNNGTVVFDGTGQEIDGSNTWYTFTKAILAAETLTIDNTSTQTFEKNVTLNGVSGELLSILSDSAGDAFDFAMTAAAVKTKMEYLSVKDSDASTSNVAHVPIAPTFSTDVSGNTDWFSSVPATPNTEFTMSRNYYY